jgi:hypothetical protein
VIEGVRTGWGVVGWVGCNGRGGIDVEVMVRDEGFALSYVGGYCWTDTWIATS